MAVAVLAILAGTMAPLALKAIDQRRAEATRKSLKLAFEALFGARDHRLGNMRADFGFTPSRSYGRLDIMVQKPMQVPRYGRNEGASFFWGYNGPYWHGRLQDGAPADAWGNPIALDFDRNAQTVQLRSTGGRLRTGAADLKYPPVPVPLASLNACVIVAISGTGQNLRGTIQVRYPGAFGDRLVETALYTIEDRPEQSSVFWVPAGGMEVVGRPGQGAGWAGFQIPLDLRPGETREVRVQL